MQNFLVTTKMVTSSKHATNVSMSLVKSFLYNCWQEGRTVKQKTLVIMTMVLICYFLLSVGIFLQQSLIPDFLDLIKTIKSFIVIFTHFETVSYFSQQLTFHANCLLWTPLETVCIECQHLLSGKNKKNIINLPSPEFAQRVVMAGDNLHGMA